MPVCTMTMFLHLVMTNSFLIFAICLLSSIPKRKVVIVLELDKAKYYQISLFLLHCNSVASQGKKQSTAI